MFNSCREETPYVSGTRVEALIDFDERHPATPSETFCCWYHQPCLPALCDMPNWYMAVATCQREKFNWKVPGPPNGQNTYVAPTRGQILQCAGALQGHKQVIKQAYLQKLSIPMVRSFVGPGPFRDLPNLWIDKFAASQINTQHTLMIVDLQWPFFSRWQSPIKKETIGVCCRSIQSYLSFRTSNEMRSTSNVIQVVKYCQRIRWRDITKRPLW